MGSQCEGDPGVAVGRLYAWTCWLSGGWATHRLILAGHRVEITWEDFLSLVCLSVHLGRYIIICLVVTWFANDQEKYLNNA